MTLDERISLYLAKCPPAVSGSDGHGTTFKVACALVNGFALDEATALRWMLVYNATCAPAWKSRELRHKVEQAAKVAHEKPRGHLLGSERANFAKAAQIVARPVPVRLTPKKKHLRTVRTVSSHISTYVGEIETVPSCIKGGSLQPSEPSAGGMEVPDPLSTAAAPSVESRPSVEMRVEWPALVPVPGCTVGRPPEIEMANADWHALEASGLAEEPMVQLAAWMFGPSCTVLEETGRADA